MAVRPKPKEVLYKCRALTDVWTGDAEGKGGRLITTGLLGSIRWWFEVLVRGLGGTACDPSQHQCRDRDHCVVCELFGCTGWARKFRFEVLDADKQPKQDQIRAGNTFYFCFVPLRHICEEEWALLDLTLRLIAGYGALGGRTVFKPSDERGREHKQHHWDYGLIKLEKILVVYIDKYPAHKPSKATLRSYLTKYKDTMTKSYQEKSSWASLENFWYVENEYLSRKSQTESTFNQIIGRPEPKNHSSRCDSWLAGYRAKPHREPESKKVFSFKYGRPCIFGFKLEAVRNKLKNIGITKIQTGEDILKKIL